MLKQKKRTLRIGIVVDESSSMTGLEKHVINALNQQLKDHRKSAKENEIDATVTISTFSTKVYDPSINSVRLQETKDLDSTTYHPHGMTALNDAILNMTRKLQANANAGDLYFLSVITDGYENSSEATGMEVKRDLENLFDSELWTIAVACPFGSKQWINEHYAIPIGNIEEWEQSAVGLQNLSVKTSGSIANLHTQYACGQTRSTNFYDGNK